MAIPHPELQRQLATAVGQAAPDLEVQFKAMFGGAGAYAFGQMFASLSDVGLGLKLPPVAQEKLLREPGAERLRYDASMPPSKQYVVVPEAIRADPAAFGAWVAVSLEHVSKLPAKKPRGR